MFKHFNYQRQTCYISLYHDLNKPKWRMWSQKTHLATVTVCQLGDDHVVWPQHPWTNWTALWTQLNVGINSSGGISAHAALSMQPAHISSWQHTTRTPAGGKVQWEQSPWSWELTTSTTTSWLWLSTSYTRRHYSALSWRRCHRMAVDIRLGNALDNNNNNSSMDIQQNTTLHQTWTWRHTQHINTTWHQHTHHGHAWSDCLL